MKEELVSFETAKLLKEKGFDTPLNMFYRHGKLQTFVEDNYNLGIEELCSAPTQSLAQKWLREKHKIDIFVIPSFAPIYNYCNSERNIDGFNLHERRFDVYESCIFKNRKMIYHATSFDLYEEALEEGLKQGLMLIK
jgi:hypothetical protein